MSTDRKWTPTNPRSTHVCQNCNSQVTPQFARVFGDNDDVVHGCPECATYREMNEKAADAGGGHQ